MKNTPLLMVVLNIGTIIATLLSFILIFIPNVNKTYAIVALALGVIFIYSFVFFKNLKDSVKINTEEISKLKEKFEISEKIADISSRLNLLEKKGK